MRRGDLNDPLLRQVLPLEAETTQAPGFSTDPVGEADLDARHGVLRKYSGRALLVATPTCAIHCRFCFRRHYQYAEHSAFGPVFDRAVTAIADDPSIHEVILSGGDPLTLGNRRLETALQKLDAIPHIDRLRLHTRLPIVLPERVDDGLLEVLGQLRRPPVVVVHSNHAAEINADVGTACAALAALGAPLLNQSVLLAGVNDSVDALAELSFALFDVGVLPYYLHMLDPVLGAAHFEVEEHRASRLIGELATRLPGYLVPRLVREIPGAGAKTPIPLMPPE